MDKLRNNTQIEILKYNPHFSGYFPIDLIEQDGMKKYENIEHLRNGLSSIGAFPCERVVPAKSVHSEYMRVTSPNALLYINFLTDSNNIGFSVSRIVDFQCFKNSSENTSMSNV